MSLLYLDTPSPAAAAMLIRKFCLSIGVGDILGDGEVTMDDVDFALHYARRHSAKHESTAAQFQALLFAVDPPLFRDQYEKNIAADLTAKITADLTAKITADLEAKITADLTAKITAGLQAKVTAGHPSDGVVGDMRDLIRKMATSLQTKDAKVAALTAELAKVRPASVGVGDDEDMTQALTDEFRPSAAKKVRILESPK